MQEDQLGLHVLTPLDPEYQQSPPGGMKLIASRLNFTRVYYFPCQVVGPDQGWFTGVVINPDPSSRTGGDLIAE